MNTKEFNELVKKSRKLPDIHKDKELSLYFEFLNATSKEQQASALNRWKEFVIKNEQIEKS